MSDCIQLLPDFIANQIAAGEVVNRPANAVKELLENAVDAKANLIKLIVKEGGKSLIQVIDDGSGMSLTDARMCFERHATSKLKHTDDLLILRTMGFRGEALASIAAIAQVELKTMREGEEFGTMVHIHGGEFKGQEPIATVKGTSIAIKNIFYNVPARRGFLKSEAAEYRLILAEFHKIVLSNPEISFQLFHDGLELANYAKTNLKQRVVQVLGKKSIPFLVPINENSKIVNINGFVGKPELAKSSYGDQYFFVNNRFIKHAYFHHAVKKAFESLLPEGKNPAYILFLELDTAMVDINRHPQKIEAQFQDDKEIYKILIAAIKRGLGYFNVSPSLNFDSRTPYDDDIDHQYKGEIKAPTIEVNVNYNPFKQQGTPSYSKGHSTLSTRSWESLYEIKEETQENQLSFPMEDEAAQKVGAKFLQLHQRYILTTIKTGMMLIDQKAAHEKILFERYSKMAHNSSFNVQQSLFPQTISLNLADFELMTSLLPEIKSLGFELQAFGKHDFIIEGYPAEVESQDQVAVLMQILNDFKNTAQEPQLNTHLKLAKSLAKSASITAKSVLAEVEMKELFDQLFACEYPNIGIDGNSIIRTLSLEEISQLF